MLMSDGLRQSIERGDYRVDPEVVALAMIGRAHALRAARRQTLLSEVLVPTKGIEIRRIGGAGEVHACPLEGAA